MPKITYLENTSTFKCKQIFKLLIGIFENRESKCPLYKRGAGATIGANGAFALDPAFLVPASSSVLFTIIELNR